MAKGLAAIGEIDAAFDWLENAVNRGLLAHEQIERSPLMEQARNDPRFQALIERMRRESAAFG